MDETRIKRVMVELTLIRDEILREAERTSYSQNMNKRCQLDKNEEMIREALDRLEYIRY